MLIAVPITVQNGSAGALVFGPLLACVLASPLWAFVAYSVMSVLVIRLADPADVPRGGRCGACWRCRRRGWRPSRRPWRLAVWQAGVEYAKLPTTPPGRCYVATAAARGHRWLSAPSR
jgi:hypothetical protein